MSDSRALRIALLTHSVNPRGGVVHTLELAEALQAAGHAVTVMAPAAAGQSFFRAVACRVSLARITGPTREVVEMVASRIDAHVAHLSAVLARQSFDIFHAQDSISGNALATLRQRGLIAGFVRTVHHLDAFDDAQLAAWQLRAFTHADQVFCVSAGWRETLWREHGIAAEQVQNGVNLVRYSPTPQAGDAAVARRFGLRPGAPVVLAVGGIEERKNSLRLLKAFSRLRAEWPSAQLVIAGGASLLDHDAFGRAFHEALAASGLQSGAGEAVIVTGPVDDAAMPALYRAADVLAMPSLREGFGLAVLEALACGTPAVVSRIAPFTEHLSDDCVHWADPFDIDSIAAALHRAARQPRFATSPGVCHRFDWAVSADRHTQLYHALTHETAPCLP